MSFNGAIIGADSDDTEEIKMKRDNYFASSDVSLADCTSACDAEASCLAVNVVEGASCDMVSTITGITNPAPGTVAAYKGYWGYNSTIPGGPPPGLNTTIPANTTSLPTEVGPVTTSVISSTTSSESQEATTSSTPVASSGFPSISANDTAPAIGPTDFPSTTYPGVIPSGVRPSGGFGFPSGGMQPMPPAGTGFPGAPSGPPSGFPAPGSFPSCDSVTCGLSGTPSTPFCHDARMQLYTINCGTSFIGASMVTISHFEATLSECADACDNTGGCQAVNYDQEQESCTMVSGVSGIEYGSVGVIGAWLGYWPSTQPPASGTAPYGTAPIGTAPIGTPPVGTAPISISIPLSTGVKAGTSSGFPTLSVNSTSSIAIGPTGTGGAFPTGGFPGPFPTGAYPTGGAGSYPSCSKAACINSQSSEVCLDASGQVYTFNCGMKFKGTIGLNSTAESMGDCQATCDGLPRCLAFNYGFGQCQFMFTVSGIEYPAYGYVGAWRGVWQGGAPGGPPQGGATGTSGLPINSANSTSFTIPVISASPTVSENSTSSVPRQTVSLSALGALGFPPSQPTAARIPSVLRASCLLATLRCPPATPATSPRAHVQAVRPARPSAWTLKASFTPSTAA